jgi:hypothetical protein
MTVYRHAPVVHTPHLSGIVNSCLIISDAIVCGSQTVVTSKNRFDDGNHLLGINGIAPLPSSASRFEEAEFLRLSADGRMVQAGQTAPPSRWHLHQRISHGLRRTRPPSGPASMFARPKRGPPRRQWRRVPPGSGSPSKSVPNEKACIQSGPFAIRAWYRWKVLSHPREPPRPWARPRQRPVRPAP